MKLFLLPGLLCLATLQAPAALVAAYQFDEIGGTTATDAKRGIAGNATLNGGATFAAGTIGNSLALDGSTGWASALNPVVDGQQQLTISAWVNVAGLTSWGTIVKDWTTTHTFHFGLDGNNGNDNFSNYIGNVGGAGGIVITSQAISTNTWYHVVCTFDDATNTQKIYLNGSLAGTGTTTGSLTTGGDIMGIGASPVPAQFLNGKIDDLAFYDNVLTDTDITKIYNDGLAGISVVPIPEPSCLPLLGLSALALLRRRRSA